MLQEKTEHPNEWWKNLNTPDTRTSDKIKEDMIKAWKAMYERLRKYPKSL